MWIARNGDGSLYLFTDEPDKDKNNGVWVCNCKNHHMELDKDMFSDITWDNSPSKYELKHVYSNVKTLLDDFKTHIDAMTLEEINEQFEEIRDYHQNKFDTTLYYYCGNVVLNYSSRYWRVLEEIPYDGHHISGYVMVDREGNTIQIKDIGFEFRKIRPNTEEYIKNIFIIK